MSPLIYLLVIFITSIGAGTAGAILGLGGGMLLVPILTMFFGVDLRYAMGAGISPLSPLPAALLPLT